MNKVFDTEQLKREYKDKFPEDWLECEDWSEGKEKESYLKCKKVIDYYSELFFVTFSYSILSGEFINKKEKIEGTITYLLKIITREYGAPEITSTFKKKIVEQYDVLNKNIKSACVAYRSIIKHYNFIHNNYRFRIYEIENTKGDNIISYFDKYVVPVCKFDFYFNYDDELFDSLLFLEKNICKLIEKKQQSIEINNVLIICKEKLHILIKKLFPYSGPSVFSIDFTDYQLTYENIKLDFLGPVVDKYELFSGINSVIPLSDNMLIKKYERNSFQGKSTFSELILLMRAYCKDPQSSKQQINNIFEEFNKRYNLFATKKSLLDFDRNALQSMKNVMYNCRLSYYLQQKDYTIKSLERDMEKIERFQIKTNVNNYFHFQLAIEYLFKKAKEQISFDELKTIRELLNRYIAEYNKAVSQCKKDGFYPLQLMFKECSFYIKDLRKTVFIPSSFSQPANYKQLEEKADDYRIRCLQIENKLDLLKEQESINELKKNLETTTSKYIEIGGIFVAVLSLLFSVVSFTNTKMDVSDIALHSFGIGFILLMFVSCIYVLTLKRDCKLSEIFKSLRFCFFAFLLIISAIALYIIIKHYSCI